LHVKHLCFKILELLLLLETDLALFWGLAVVGFLFALLSPRARDATV